MKSRTFYFLFSSFLLGVWIFSFLSFTRLVFLIVPAICICCTVFIFFMRRPKGFRMRNISLVFLVSLFFLFGAARIGVYQYEDHFLDERVAGEVSLQGIVCDEPEEKETTRRFCFEPSDYGDRILITVPKYPRFDYGDELLVRGTLEFPENFLSYEGGPEFDYVSYLFARGFRYVMFMPDIRNVGKDRGNPVMEFLLSVKDGFSKKLRSLIPEPEASLAGGLLLGDRQSMSEDMTEEFKNAGLVHILVLSGYNVTIVAESLMKTLSFLPHIFGRTLGIVSIILFALMTGAGATTIRASVMALIAICARSGARRYDVTRALFLAAFFMVLENPYVLAFDVSFQLSFLATLAVIYVAPVVSSRLTYVTQKFNLREVLSTTLSTQIFLLPYILHVMGQLSIIAPISNLFVLPVVPYAMFGSFMAPLTGFVFHAAAIPLAWITTALLSYIVRAVSLFGNLPFASVKISIGIPLLLVTYFLYTLFFLRLKKSMQSVK